MSESKTSKVPMTDGQSERIREAAAILRRGGCVIVPTETVYGVAADAECEAAVERLYVLKGRPETKPISILVADPDDVWRYWNEAATACNDLHILAHRFWPGPLTIVAPAAASVSARVTAGTGTVGMRVPDHELTRAVLRAAGLGAATPSANRSGDPPPTTAEAARAQLRDAVDMVLDGGACTVGVASTVVRWDPVSGFEILREGDLSASVLFASLS